MNRTLLIATGLALALMAGSASAQDPNDVDKRVVVHKDNDTVRRTVTERPNGNVVRRTVTAQPNGNVAVTRKVFRAPRRFHVARPWIAPRGFVYRRFALGERVPAVLLAADFFLLDYGIYGLAPPPAGYVWVREGNDAVLADRYSGEVVQVAYDIFY